VAHLQGVTFELGTTVGTALELLASEAQSGAYVRTLPKRVTGPANSVVLFSSDMQWSDFVGALVKADVERCVWIAELCCALDGDLDTSDDATAARTGVAELVLPSWMNVERLWTPGNCAAARAPGVECVFHMCARSERDLAKAMIAGLPQRFYDALLAPQGGRVGARALRAIASWLRGVMDDAVLAHLDARAQATLLGQVACATGDWETAKSCFEAAGDSIALALPYQRAGRLRDARDILREAIVSADGGGTGALQLARVLLDLGECEEAIAVVDTLLLEARGSQREAECWALLTTLYDVRGDTVRAAECASEALRVARDAGDALQTADALAQLGRIELDELRRADAALEHATDALVAYKTVFGDAHAKALACEQLMARAHQACGDAASAVASLRYVSATHQRLFGPEHAKAMASSALLADALLAGGWTAEGTAELERLHRRQVAQHGADSDVAAQTLKRMARQRSSRG